MPFSLGPLARDQSEAPTGAELLVIGTKNEDNDFFPQGRNTGKRSILTLKLDRRTVNFY